MRVGTILQRVSVSFLREGDRFYVNLSSARPVRYTVLWAGNAYIEGVTKGGRVRRFRVTEVWRELQDGSSALGASGASENRTEGSMKRAFCQEGMGYFGDIELLCIK